MSEKITAGTLYIVGTPIGNLNDVTLRCISILKEVNYIIAEDTRVTKKLTDFIFNPLPDLLPPRIISYHQHSDEAKKLEILNLLVSGKNIALVTDAGTPGISDPGNELVDYLLSYKKDLKIIPIPGASAITSALSVCGFDINKFVFLGFLPKKKRNKLFSWLKEGKINFAFYESPKRILKTLKILEEFFGGFIRVFVARELTKMHETTYRGKVGEVHDLLEKGKIKGECVVVVEQ